MYGVTANGRTILKSTKGHSSEFITVPVSDFDTVKVKDTTNVAVMIGSELIINDTNRTPPPVHTHDEPQAVKFLSRNLIS